MGSLSNAHISLILIRLVLNYLLEFLLDRKIRSKNLVLPRQCIVCLKANRRWKNSLSFYSCKSAFLLVIQLVQAHILIWQINFHMFIALKTKPKTLTP